MSERKCANCRNVIGARFCSICGQRDREIRISFWSLVIEALKEAWEIDGRLPRTLIPFLFRPGFLAREYLEGRRVHYSSPLRIYLFALVVSFFALSFVAEKLSKDIPVNATIVADAKDQAPSESVQAKQALLPADTPASNSTDTDAAAQTQWTHLLHEAVREEMKTEGKHFPPALIAKVAEFERLGDTLALQQIRRSFFDLAPKVVSVLVPIFAGILQLLFVRNSFFYIDHILFSLNFSSVALLFGSLATLIPGWGGALLTLAIPTHLYLAMRRVYQHSHLVTMFKFIALTLLGTIVTLAALILAAVAALWFA
jgi:hypothetical protein